MLLLNSLLNHWQKILLFLHEVVHCLDVCGVVQGIFQVLLYQNDPVYRCVLDRVSILILTDGDHYY